MDWGSFSLVAALKNLLRTGLEDRLNQKFILLSESGVPIYPPEVLWLELMVEEKSRINACELWDGVRARASATDPHNPQKQTLLKPYYSEIN